MSGDERWRQVFFTAHPWLTPTTENRLVSRFFYRPHAYRDTRLYNCSSRIQRSGKLDCRFPEKIQYLNYCWISLGKTDNHPITLENTCQIISCIHFYRLSAISWRSVILIATKKCIFIEGYPSYSGHILVFMLFYLHAENIWYNIMALVQKFF